jgi:hypothetical protein
MPPTPVVPLTGRNESAGQAVIVVSVLLAGGIEVSVYRVRDGLVSAPCFVQVDHGGALAVVSYRPVRSHGQGRRSVCTYCFIVSYVGVAYPPAESP